MASKQYSLVDDFQKYFSVDLALSDDQKDRAFKIRYRVYCEEFGYEAVQDASNPLETDTFDRDSVHCLITHLGSSMPAGCVRLVCPDQSSVMPFEAFCGHALDEKLIKSLNLPRDSVCEFSRLAVDGAFRRRSGEKLTRFGEIQGLDLSKREQRTFSLIAVSLFIAAFAASDLINRPGCFAMMEPFLPRMLKRSGIVVRKVGEEVDYHGQRAPYFITSTEARAQMHAELSELHDTVTSRFASQLAGFDEARISNAS